MKICYYALKNVAVGAGTRHAGDLIPEATEWPYLNFYVERGDIAPVLVAVLPQEMQDKLAAWEATRNSPDITPAVDQEADQEAGDADLTAEQAKTGTDPQPVVAAPVKRGPGRPRKAGK